VNREINVHKYCKVNKEANVHITNGTYNSPKLPRKKEAKYAK
jgi:hypothetical protein